MNGFLSQCISAYRGNYSSCHVLIRSFENWKGSSNKNFATDALLMDLSKTFDCISYDLLVAKPHAYGISLNVATFIYSFLKRRKQNAKINGFSSSFQTLLSGASQDSVLGPILFNIFLNDLLALLKKSQVYNFADDNSISAEGNSTDDILKILKEKPESTVKWFRETTQL